MQCLIKVLRVLYSGVIQGRVERSFEIIFTVSAVRRGRYTHQVKVKNIIEAKKHLETKPYSVPNQKRSTSSSKSSSVPQPSGSSSLSSPPSSAKISINGSQGSSGTSSDVTVNGIAISTGQVAATGLSSETKDLLAEAIQAHGLDDADTFEYHPEAFDNLEMDVRSKNKFLLNLFLNTRHT